jgi:cytochrome bd-type quinol oxidase subunit 2
MTFYVGLVLNFMSKREEDYVVLHNPRILAFVFTIMVIFISILRAGTLVYAKVLIETLALFILLSTPNAIIEGYGIFQTIERALKRNMTTKALAEIYLLFLIAALLEVGYVYLLRAWV